MMKNGFNIENGKKIINDFLKKQNIKIKARKASRHYVEIINSLKKSGRTKLNFAAYVIYDSTYGMDGVFQLMLQEEQHWNPKIVIIPDILRGGEHAKETYLATKRFFVNKYGADYVIDGWNPETNEFGDHTDKFDIIYYANPYDSLVHEYHKIEYATQKNVLPIYVSYGYEMGKYATLSRLTSPELNLVWKCFADTTYTFEDYLQYQIIKGKNVVLAGYSKMDAMQYYPQVENKRKKILITPHHTVSAKDLPLSNFLEYCDLILKLPDIFPELDFVFRPHPLLFTALVNNGFWTKEKVNEYINALKDRNIEYSKGGDYLGIFAECDAIVNDCGSFTVEWLYTGKPGCFVYNRNLKEEHLTKLMNEAILRHSIARTEDDIINFIESVSKNEKRKPQKMEQWVVDNIVLNYPYTSQFIIKEIDVLNSKN